MEKGGTERVISNLCNEYLIKNYKLSVVTYLPFACSYQLNEKIHVYSLETEQKGNAVQKFLEMKDVNRQYVKVMSAIKPDIIIAFLPRPCMVACAMRKKLGVPVIGSIRSDPALNFKNRLYRIFARNLYDRADGFVFQTAQAREFFHKRLQKKSVVIMNPVNAGAVRTPYHGERAKRIVSAGRCTEQKNYPLLLRAFAGLDQVHKAYTLWIYGKYDERLQLKELAEKLGVADRVVFAGQTDHLYDDIYDAALYVLSSKSEGMPNALLEAMALGLPVIATDCPSGGPRALISDGINGVLVPNEDERALKQAMDKMLSDSVRAEEMARNAHKTGSRFSGMQIYKEWEKYLFHVIRKEKR